MEIFDLYVHVCKQEVSMRRTHIISIFGLDNILLKTWWGPNFDYFSFIFAGVFFKHHANMSVKCTPPCTPLLHSKTGFVVVVFLLSFFLFCSGAWIVGAHWNRLIEAVLACARGRCFGQK